MFTHTHTKSDLNAEGRTSWYIALILVAKGWSMSKDERTALRWSEVWERKKQKRRTEKVRWEDKSERRDKERRPGDERRKTYNVTIPLHPMTAFEVLCWKKPWFTRQHRGRLCLGAGQGELTCTRETAMKAWLHCSCPTLHYVPYEWRWGGDSEQGRRTVAEDGWIRLVYDETLPK